MKICVYAISKNEEDFVERFCKSAEDADLIMIADTGSSDDTIAKAREYGAVVHDICISPSCRYTPLPVARGNVINIFP